MFLASAVLYIEFSYSRENIPRSPGKSKGYTPTMPKLGRASRTEL